MAIATGMAIALGVSAAASAGQAIAGEVKRSKAKKALQNFRRQELKNVTEGMRVSTLGAQLNTREAQRRFATSVDALRSGGVRGVVGGLGAQEQLMQNQQASIAAELDRQQVMIEQMRAQDEANIRGMQEQRDSFDQQVLLGQKAAGRQATMSAVGDLASAASFAAMNATFGDAPSAASTLAKQGIQQPFGGGTGFQFYGLGTNPPPANQFGQFVQAGQQMSQPEYFNLLPDEEN